MHLPFPCFKKTPNYSCKRNKHIIFYPNPSNGHITFKSDINKKLTIYLYSNDGRNILIKHLDSNDKELPLDELKKGLYFIKIYSDDVYLLDKLIINWLKNNLLALTICIGNGGESPVY